MIICLKTAIGISSNLVKPLELVLNQNKGRETRRGCLTCWFAERNCKVSVFEIYLAQKVVLF